jgi:hypothetical protein
MRQINGTLKDLLLEQEESKEQNTQTKPKFLQNILGENFQIDLDISKKGIEMGITPVNETGDMILNLSQDELDSLVKSLEATLKAKFARAKMTVAAGKAKAEEKAVKFTIPNEDIFKFIQYIVKSA